jgi:peptidoglycan-N-acetylglucosamine deacetylase
MISVVIPAYNEARLIRKCLESLQKQDYPGEYEVIVVDNNCRDNTARNACEMGARVVPCARQGVTYARQAGAESARGQIIVQADADTNYPTWWLSRIQNQFDRHPDAAAVAGTFVYQDPPWWGVFEMFLRAFVNLLFTLVLGRPIAPSGANFAFSQKAFREIGGYDPLAYSADQYNIVTRLSKIGRIIYDTRSWGATSARSVAKPIIVIIYDLFRHLFKFARHVLTRPFKWVRRHSPKITAVSPGIYVKFMVPALIIGILVYGYVVPAAPVFGRVYAGLPTSDKVIALTFDDGPNEPYTSQILAILGQYDVKATFFLIGKNVELYPEVVLRMLADGQVIGNHSFTHNANHALSFSYYKDIDKAEQVIADVTGVKTALYRPPHGRKSPWELKNITRMGYKEILWDISTNELSKHDPAFLADQIIKKSRPGGIIDLHDGYGVQHNNLRADKSNVVQMLPLIIEKLEAEGYTFVTIPQLLNIPAYIQVTQWTHY